MTGRSLDRFVRGQRAIHRPAVAIFIALVLASSPLRAQCPDGTPPPCRRAPRPGPTSVAVLPLESLSPDTADTYVADGLTDELVQRLQTAGLPVLSAAAVRRFRGSTAAPDEIGRALNVTYLLSGSVRRSRDVLRVTVELVRASGGVRVWGATFDRAANDVLAVETEVAVHAAEAIAGRLQPGQRQALVRRVTTSGPAYDAYLRGSVELARRTAASAQRALAAYQDATRLDPGFTRAWARMGFVYGLSALYLWPELGLSRDSLLARGTAAADRAMALDSAEAETWMARAYLSLQSPRPMGEALSALQRAAALNSNSAEVHHQLGFVLLHMDRVDEAEAELRRALAIDPGRRVTMNTLGGVAWNRRRWAEMVAWNDSATAVEPWFLSYSWRARGKLALGDTTGARQDAEAALALRRPYLSSVDEATLAVLDIRGGDTASARHRLMRLEHPTAPLAGDPTNVFEANLAVVRLALGDRAGALQALEAAQPRSWRLYWAVAAEPNLDPLRGEPRLERLLQEARPR
jgi:TolB-like protein/Tfp pilus assembly protein PilF